MSGGLDDDIIAQASNVVDERFAKLETDAARALIQDSFALLPWELQELYRDIEDLHRLGRYEDANRIWEAWLQNAREMGLI